MAILSRLFGGDRALESCSVRDSAHIQLGATGDHVGKIQMALELVDDSNIEKAELAANKYGESTARAVLDYKKKRRIINFSYQSKADNIVVKMTIAALDKELYAFENGSFRRPGCGDRIGAGKRGATSSHSPMDGPLAGDASSPKVFPARLRVVWQPTAGGVKVDAHRHLVQLTQANELLNFFDMEIVGVVSFPDETIPHHVTVDSRFATEIFRVREAAEKQRPGIPPNVLRIVACPMEPRDIFGLTEGGFGSAKILERFQPFVLVNVSVMRPDRFTVLHEMIHAATALDEKDHDPDPDSVFSDGGNRSILKRTHAEALSKGFFAVPK